MRVADGFLEKAARSSVKHEKDIKRQVLGNEGMVARSSGAVETKTVQDENDGNGKIAARE